MITNRMESIELLASNSLDREDLLFYPASRYPSAYKLLQQKINEVFEKSELLLKCKLKFNQVVRNSISDSEIVNSQLNMSLIITGTVKAGKSSFLNLLLNTKIVPPGIIGSSICMELFHPKNENKTIAIGVHEWTGWEVNKYTDLSVEELPQKLLDIQKELTSQGSSSRPAFSSGKRIIKIQLPHWFLKNTTIYKCSSIDGIYSFDEPFELITMSKNPILLHVIDASNGIMDWDRTFLSRIKYMKPNLPIFFVINRVDIDMDVVYRDNLSMRFDTSIDHYGIGSQCSSPVHPVAGGSAPCETDSTTPSESDCNSNDTSVSTGNPAQKQDHLIKRANGQISKIGFSMSNGSFVSSASFSAKQFTKYLQEGNYSGENADKMKDINDKFFEAIQNFLSQWYWKIFVTSLMHFKSKLNGIVESILCDISIYQRQVEPEFITSQFIREITKRERNMFEMITKTTGSIEKEILKIIKDQIMKYENQIIIRKDQIRSDDLMKVFTLMQPMIHSSIENILLPNQDTLSRKKRSSSTNKTPRPSTSSFTSEPSSNNAASRLSDATIVHLSQDKKSAPVSTATKSTKFEINNKISNVITNNIQILDKEIYNLRKQPVNYQVKSYYWRDIYRLYKVLKKTIVYPHIVEIPHEILTSDRTRLEEFKIKLKRTFTWNDLQEADILKFAINSITVEPLIGITLDSIRSIATMIQQFGQMYQKSYKIARGLNLVQSLHLNELITCDTLIDLSITEKQDRTELNPSSLTRLQGFVYPFLEWHEKPDKMFMECSSTSFLSLEPFCPALWFIRVGASSNKSLLLPDHHIMLTNEKCLFSFSKLNFDLFSRIKMKPIWTPYQIGNIIYQLVNVAKDIQPFNSIFSLRFELTNIYLKQNDDQYKCHYHPFYKRLVGSSLQNIYDNSYQEADVVVSHPETFVYQLGVIMLNLLLNETLCRYLLPLSDTTYSDEEKIHFKRSIKNKIFASNNNDDLVHLDEQRPLFNNEEQVQAKQELVNICLRILLNVDIEKKEPITSLEIFSKELERIIRKIGR